MQSTRTCSVDGCGSSAGRRGMCNTHYRRVLHAKASPCSVPGCRNRIRAKKLCSAHYKRISDRGSTDPAEPLRAFKPGQKCSVNGCDRVAKARSYCRTHHSRLIRHGEPTGGIVRNYDPVPCSEEGCVNMARTGGLCHKHAERKRTRELRGFSGERDCAQCGEAIDFGEVPGTGRARRSLAMVCFKCRARNVSPFWVKIRRRDGDSCSLCGKLIDFDLRFPAPQSRSVDHIAPYSRGGTDELDNLQLAHLRCNIQKSNRI